MNKNLLLKLKKLGQHFNILYVEDEEDIRNIMESVLKQFFAKVYIAKDGEEGLEIFKSQSIDIVLTDIEMPIMNGLDMIKKIRKISYDVPIGIISAFNDTQKFTKAIKYGVNRYLLKPIEQENVINTIGNMLIELKNKIDAKKHHKQIQNEKLSLAVKKTAEYFLQTIPSPIFVVDADKKIVYFNELLNNMLLQKNTKVKVGDSVSKIESIFSYEDNKLVSVDEIQNKLSLNKKIRYENDKECLDFIPLKQDVEIATVEGKGAIIVLNDITIQMKQIHMIEYQKQKLQSNKEILEEFLSRNIFTVKENLKKDSKKVLQKSEINEDEALLRRAHVYNISANDYIMTLNDTIEDDLDELNELELDLQSELYEFEYSQKIETLKAISVIFNKYAKILIKLIEFSDLGDAVKHVADYLDELTKEHIELNSFMIKEVIQSVYNDLSNWKEMVFITQTTDNIHYLDSSLYNTIIELKNVLENREDEDEEDEDVLEFF